MPIGRLHEEVESLESGGGLSMTGVLDLPTSLGHLVKWLIRVRTAGVEEVAAHLGEDEAVVRLILKTLVEKGLLEEVPLRGEIGYRAHMVSRDKPTVSKNLWKILD